MDRMIKSVFDGDGDLLNAFLRGCHDVGWGAVISFEPGGSQLDGAVFSIVQTQGERWKGGGIRMGRGATLTEAISDLATQPWAPGLTLEQAQEENVVL